VYNIYQYLQELGQKVEVVRNDRITVEEAEKINPDYIFISPGPGNPDDAGVSLEMVKYFAGKKPILGICLGHQVIGQVFGGKIVQAPNIMHGKLSKIVHNGKGIYEGIPSALNVTRYHSLVVDKAGFPDSLEITSESEDGLIMGLKHREFPIEGVQFHPEAILSEYGKKLFLNFLEKNAPAPPATQSENRMKEFIDRVVMGKNLNENEMRDAVNIIMDGKASDSQIAAFLTALRLKGETVEEVTGAVKVMREKAIKIKKPEGAFVVDTCGTGGDKSGTFNISTAAAFVAAGAGVTVAKHGNRAVSSKSGSADVLKELGVKIDLDPEKAQECLEEAGIAFLFAPKHHLSMKHAIGPRREIGIRTIFNILGPLSNPAEADGQVLGVFSPDLTEILADVLLNLGVRRGFVVHGGDGLDEISTASYTKVTEINGDWKKTYTLLPENLGFERSRHEDLKGGDASENAKIITDILQNREKGPKTDIVLLNSAAAIVSGKKADTIEEGVELARKSIESGAAYEKLQKLIEVSNR
jgi:anthranilate synthase/phosphoribosyltransferase